MRLAWLTLIPYEIAFIGAPVVDLFRKPPHFGQLRSRGVACQKSLENPVEDWTHVTVESYCRPWKRNVCFRRRLSTIKHLVYTSRGRVCEALSIVLLETRSWSNIPNSQPERSGTRNRSVMTDSFLYAVFVAPRLDIAMSFPSMPADLRTSLASAVGPPTIPVTTRAVTAPSSATRGKRTITARDQLTHVSPSRLAVICQRTFGPKTYPPPRRPCKIFEKRQQWTSWCQLWSLPGQVGRSRRSKAQKPVLTGWQLSDLLLQ